jgi:hypothetical protein
MQWSAKKENSWDIAKQIRCAGNNEAFFQQNNALFNGILLVYYETKDKSVIDESKLCNLENIMYYSALFFYQSTG